MEAAGHTQTLIVHVDDREAASPVPDALRKIPGVEVCFRRLAVGDYEVNRRCVFERKTVADFAASIADGRLFVQAHKLARLSVPTAIILEGRIGPSSPVQMRREALQGAMISLSLIFRLPVLRTFDAKETAKLMLLAASQMSRHESGAIVYHGYRPKRKRNVQLRILQSLPGIGPSRTTELLDRFGSVEAVITASREKLQQVDGIGSGTAARIRDVLQELPSVYGNCRSNHC